MYNWTNYDGWIWNIGLSPPCSQGENQTSLQIRNRKWTIKWQQIFVQLVGIKSTIPDLLCGSFYQQTILQSEFQSKPFYQLYWDLKHAE
jgi:hypothetical protein